MAVRLLYSSLGDGSRQRAERAVRAALDTHHGEWVVSLVDPPHQELCVILIDGPNGWTRSWIFDADESIGAMRDAIVRDVACADDHPTSRDIGG
jgi:hypothetical protein